ncbi:hypothetical protein BH23GEM7_BH23GEM7_30940 [soil metagenome]|nr:hypothetical protein [Gemmatimonadota bacterium]
MADLSSLPDLSEKWPERLARVRSIPPAEGLVRPPRDAAKQALLEEMDQRGPYEPATIAEEPNLAQPKAPTRPTEEQP